MDGLDPYMSQTVIGAQTIGLPKPSSLQITMDRRGHLFPSENHKLAMDQIAKGLFV
jgi:hypothetical protein